jgi:hypothetical protein
MDHTHGMARGKPGFDPRDYDCLVGRSVVGMRPGKRCLGTILHICGLHWAALHSKADS